MNLENLSCKPPFLPYNTRSMKPFPAPSPEKYPTLAGLTKPDGETPINPQTCSPFEIVHAAFAQDDQLRGEGWRMYKAIGRGDRHTEIDLVGAITEHYGTKLFTMTPQEICDAYRKVMTVMQTVDDQKRLSRDTIQGIAGMAMWKRKDVSNSDVEEGMAEEVMAA